MTLPVALELWMAGLCFVGLVGIALGRAGDRWTSGLRAVQFSAWLGLVAADLWPRLGGAVILDASRAYVVPMAITAVVEGVLAARLVARARRRDDASSSVRGGT